MHTRFTQRKAQGPSRTRNESTEEDKEEPPGLGSLARLVFEIPASGHELVCMTLVRLYAGYRKKKLIRPERDTIAGIRIAQMVSRMCCNLC